jgi:hypothetical protein
MILRIGFLLDLLKFFFVDLRTFRFSGNVADGRLQQLEQVRVSAQEARIRQMGIEIGAKQ